MIRKIIKIDEEKCNGCGLCAEACHEGAIGMCDGKAKLLREDYCDGLGDCLPVCPTGAITFVEREAAAYDEEAVKASQCSCPSTRAHSISRNVRQPEQRAQVTQQEANSQLRQWPVQIKLVPANAPYFNGAHLLIAADCAAYAYGNFHTEYMKNKITLIGCPKLDSGYYSEKLANIIGVNDIKGITVVRMEVPCCGGLVEDVKDALQKSGKMIPWQVVTISTDGRVIDE